MCLTTESKEKYKKYLEDLANNNSDEIFSNGGKDHATVLYKILLDKSKNIVRIFCEEGVSPIWQDSDVREALKEFVEREGTELRIFIENQGDEGFAEVRPRSNVTIHHIPQNGIDKIHKHFENDNCNFAIFDNKMYRYEYDKRLYRAYGSFNNPEIASSMISLFDEIWNQPVN